MKRKRAVVLLATTLALLGSALAWLYTHPPLMSSGYHQLKAHAESTRTRAYGIDLENKGRWSVTLTGVTVNGQGVDYPGAMGVGSYGHLAGNAAISLERYREMLELGPVKGWRIPPSQSPGSLNSYGVRLDWEAIGAAQADVVVHYRYLGLPMQYRMADEWGPLH